MRHFHMGSQRAVVNMMKEDAVRGLHMRERWEHGQVQAAIMLATAAGGCARLATMLIMLSTSTLSAMSSIMATMSTIATLPFGPLCI